VYFTFGDPNSYQAFDDIFSTGIDTPETKAARIDFCEKLANIVNHEILGSATNPSQWQVPVSDKAKKDEDDTDRINIGDLRLQGPQLRKFMKKINLVILKCTPEEKQTLTLSTVRYYITAEDIPSQHHDYLDEDIEQFQTETDHFMRGWVDLYGLVGISIYIHMFISGHLMWFTEEYWNLHQLSQKGFESMNALVTSFFFPCIQRGGFTATNNPKSKLLSIACWLQR
jgi:hypothetical protein